MTADLVSIEYTSVARLARVFGVIPIEVKAALRPALIKAANLVADQAKLNASYSEDIPGAIYVRAGVTSRAGATVGVSAAKAPQAKVLELGNYGKRSVTTFRHPVFGNTNTWVDQPTQPFLFPAVTSKGAEASALVAAAVREVAARHGLS